MRPSPRLAELALVLAIVAGGAWLRWHHLDTPSLWWDELVEVRVAERPTIGEVWRGARDGVLPGTGNAGAVPLDYLALHAWLALTPAPPPDAMERHYRVPAFVFAVLAVPLVWGLGRAVGGPAAGTLAAGLLATSIPHVLYAAEARFYSLSVLATLANLAAFTALVRAPSGRRLAAFTLVSIAYVLSALYGIFPVAAEYLVLAVLAWRARREAPTRRLVLATCASALVVVVVLATWLGRAAVGVQYGRGVPVSPPVFSALPGTLLFFTGYVSWLAAVFGAALVVAPIVVRRDRVATALVAVCLLSACSPPVMVLVAYAKQYYFHPRHALFLLPMVELATALVLGRVIGRLVHAPFGAALVGAVVGTALGGTLVPAYVAGPTPYFRMTKTLRDYRGLARAVAARTAGLGSTERYLLVLELHRAGHLANPTIAFYLDAYGLTDRVMLASTTDPLALLQKLPATCAADGCRHATTIDLLQRLDIGDPFDQPPIMRRLMALRASTWAPTTSGIGAVTWAPTLPPPQRGLGDTRLDGLTLFDVLPP